MVGNTPLGIFFIFNTSLNIYNLSYYSIMADYFQVKMKKIIYIFLKNLLELSFKI